MENITISCISRKGEGFPSKVLYKVNGEFTVDEIKEKISEAIAASEKELKNNFDATGCPFINVERENYKLHFGILADAERNEGVLFYWDGDGESQDQYISIEEFLTATY